MFLIPPIFVAVEQLFLGALPFLLYCLSRFYTGELPYKNIQLKLLTNIYRIFVNYCMTNISNMLNS